MVLNSQTFDKVRGLFPSMPYNFATYNYALGDIVSFSVGHRTESGVITAQVEAFVTPEFKLSRVKRIACRWGIHIGRKYGMHHEVYPIHPSGSKLLMHSF